MNIFTIIVIVILVVAIGAAVISVVSKKKKGQVGCGYCPYGGSCDKMNCPSAKLQNGKK